MNKTPDMAEYGTLEDALGHRFATPGLLAQALRHASMTLDASGRLDSNERMEFLGDRMLGLAVATLLYDRFPNEEEGALAIRFATLVSGEILARVAVDLGLGAYIALSPGEAGAGGRDNPATLANALEAVIGALYLDGGTRAAKTFIQSRWSTLIDADLTPPKDPKTGLQEWCQARGMALPVYTEQGRTGPAHAPLFVISVAIATGGTAEAEGASKREAERLAAEKLLHQLDGVS